MLDHNRPCNPAGDREEKRYAEWAVRDSITRTSVINVSLSRLKTIQKCVREIDLKRIYLCVKIKISHLLIDNVYLFAIFIFIKNASFLL